VGVVLRRRHLLQANDFAPIYDGALAKKLGESVTQSERFSCSFYAPVSGRDFIEFSSDEDPADTIKRVLS
jgi:hypothetical protein